MKVDFDKWAEDGDLHDGEQGPVLLRAVSDAYEAGRQVLNLLMSFSSMRQALTPALKIFAHLDKPAVQDFLAEARCARALAGLEGYLPAEYLETELKILACMALKNGELEELINSLSTSVLSKRFPEDAALQVQRSVQCSASGARGCVCFVLRLLGDVAVCRALGDAAFCLRRWAMQRFVLFCGCWVMLRSLSAETRTGLSCDQGAVQGHYGDLVFRHVRGAGSPAEQAHS